MTIYKLQRLDNNEWHKGRDRWINNEQQAKPYKQFNHASSVITYFGYDKTDIRFKVVKYELTAVDSKILN